MSESIVYITLTRQELVDIIHDTVKSTLAHVNLKASGLNSGRIYRQEMIRILGSPSRFENARRRGQLKVHKDGNRTSKVWARREDFKRFLKLHTQNN